MFEGQPKGLFALALANTGERFGYYTMLAVFTLFLKANFHFDENVAGQIYGGFLAFVYFLPFVGGILADKYGFGKMVTLGIFVMFGGYLLLSIPAGNGTTALILMFGALTFISIGTGLFKGNLQVMVGNLYDAPELQGKRDSAFSIFYMAINIGALFAPSTAEAIMNYAQKTLGYSEADSYHFAFGVACLSLIVSILIYQLFKRTFRHADRNKATAAATTAHEEEISPAESKERMIALCLVFAVVIFFWMAFHQNGLTLTWFARDYTNTSATGIQGMAFSVWNLVAVIVTVYALFSVFQSKKQSARLISCIVVLAAVGFLVYQYQGSAETVTYKASIFQQFNPFYVIALTPVSMAIFGALAKRGKEPSAPRKIGIGMLIAAIGFGLMVYASIGLDPASVQTPAVEAGQNVTRVSPYWLISTYLVLTFAELLLSPMGISFVSKVAPPKYKGMMMGGWFVATAIGNYLTSVGASVWNKLPIWGVWSIFVVLCLLSALFLFSILKRLEKVAK